MKKTWARTLGSMALAMAALAGGIVPAGAQISPKQPRASGAASPPMPMRSITNQQRKTAAEELARRRTVARSGNTVGANNAGYQNSSNPVGSSNSGYQNSNTAVGSSNAVHQNLHNPVTRSGPRQQNSHTGGDER